MLVAGLIILNVAVVATCAAAYWAVEAARAVGRTPRRELERRRDHVREHPEQVNSLDVQLLLAESLPVDRAADVCWLARSRRIPALVLWVWIELYDAELLALAVEAGLTPAEMLHHATTGTPPDRRSLEIFAAFHGSIAS